MHEKYRLVFEGSLLRNLKISIFLVHAYGFEVVHSVLIYEWGLFFHFLLYESIDFHAHWAMFFVATSSVVLVVGIGLLQSVPVTYPSGRAR